MSINTLKTLANNGKIKSFKTTGEHRRFRQEDLNAYMGVEKEKQEKLTVIYARCSTAKQKENLGDNLETLKLLPKAYLRKMETCTAKIKHGDCLNVLADYPDNTFDLIVTSPPYADKRRNTYGGIAPDKYVEWFIPRSQQFLRVLKPTGTFILNIKEKTENGERHTFVLELILALRKQGWLWTEEFIWHKKNCYPGKWPNRFRDAWERCLQFNKTRHFKMNQEAVMVPMGDWAAARLKSLGKNDVVRFDSQVGSGFGKNITNWIGRDKAYPSNVLHLATECGNKNHSAAFPEALPEWFIKLFTDAGDLILDPFAGSGTTCAVAQKLRRNSVGIEILAEYCGLAVPRFVTSASEAHPGNVG